ncbi:hypothetical protein CR513_47313, partial [Mucuna pruriens]
MVNEIGAVDNLRLGNQLTELTSLVRQLAIGQHEPSMVARFCGICTSIEHPTDMCPTLQETESSHPKSVGAIGGYLYEKVGNLIINIGSNHFGRGRPSPQYQALPFQQQQQQRVPGQGNSPSLEDLMKQLATSNMEFQQNMNSNNMKFQQNMSATIQDLKMQIGQLANILLGSSNLPSQTIPNLRGNAMEKNCHSQHYNNYQDRLRLTLSRMPTHRCPSKTRLKPESSEELLRMFWKLEINILLLDALKQIPKYAKFLNELCVHKRKKMKGEVELAGILSVLTRNEDFFVGAQLALPKKCQDSEFSLSHAPLVIAPTRIDISSDKHSSIQGNNNFE